jgi:hypothetical protein
VADTEARDRRVIGREVRSDDPRSDVLDTAPLDLPRRAHPDRIAEHQQRHHQRRIVRRTALPVSAIGAIERRQIKLADDIEHEPRQVLGRQPVTNRRRKQELLLAISDDEPLDHARKSLKPGGQTAELRNSLRAGLS